MQSQHTNLTQNKNFLNNPYIKSALIWCCTLIILALSGWIGEFTELSAGVSFNYRYIIQALIMSGLLVPIVWFFTSQYDNNLMGEVGFQGLKKSSKWFLLGAGLILTPMIITLVATQVFGWGTIEFNNSSSMVSTLIIGILTVFLFEALPEELAFRGYIFSQLNTRHNKWVAGVFSVLLFVLLPITLYNIQSLFFTNAISVGGQTTLSGSYVITMLFFGSIVQGLRILTGTIWTGIGFHLAFVYSDRLVGISQSDMIIISDASNETAPQVLLLSLIVLALVIIIGISYQKKQNDIKLAI